MAHYAKVVEGIVETVIVADQEWINGLEGQWVQTSYNTQGGVHLLGDTPLRKNYAGIGDTYDAERDAFIAPKPYDSWTLNEETCLWESPVPYPEEGMHTWDEEAGKWVEMGLDE